ncbi:MAG: hypothetical protein QOG93_860, partial [Gaiellaceae bacterium]|nr:hypothetical protein [Gaiellaceae bacterium]
RPRLPVFDQVVFIDWHGVLSTRRFWASLERAPHHQLWADVSPRVTRLFATDVGDEWMRGRLRTRDIIEHHLLDLPEPPLVEFLECWLAIECERVRPRPRMLDLIRTLRRRSHIVLATDNTDCFTDALRRRTDLRRHFDDYLSSADLGVLKSDDAAAFFLPWMDARGLDPERAVLIDDRRRNCDGFERLGGTSIVFDDSEYCWTKLRELAVSLE